MTRPADSPLRGRQDAAPEDLDRLYKLTERYCVVYQTLTGGAPVTISRSDSAASA